MAKYYYIADDATHRSKDHAMHRELLLSAVLLQVRLHPRLQLGYGVYKTISYSKIVSQYARNDELSHVHGRSVWS